MMKLRDLFRRKPPPPMTGTPMWPYTDTFDDLIARGELAAVAEAMNESDALQREAWKQDDRETAAQALDHSDGWLLFTTAADGTVAAYWCSGKYDDELAEAVIDTAARLESQ